MTAVYHVSKIVTAPSRLVSGRSSGRAVMPLFLGSTPIFDDFSSVLGMARMSSGTLPGLMRFLTSLNGLVL